MAYSFTQIEKDKSRTISAAFFFLVFIYFAGIWVIALMVKNFWYFQGLFDSESVFYQNVSFAGLGIKSSFYIAFWSVVTAGVHWFFALLDLVERLNGILRARPPSSDHLQEKMFQNIVEEVSVATGGSAIQPMIIPSMMLNACAYSDGRAVPVVAVTAGLLAKLNRSQLEAVVGHEAAHIVSEDCQSTTIISAMFEIFGAVLLAGNYVLEGAFGESQSKHRNSAGWRLPSGVDRSDGSGSRIAPVILFAMLIMLIIWLVNNLARLMRMFISRQREYRADATAVRLTRNPLALAEALHIIGHRRHSLFEGRDSLQSLFIVNPHLSPLDDGEGLVPDLFSTHPPLQERIKILLSMAHVDEGVLSEALKKVNEQEDHELEQRQKAIGQATGGLWYVKTPSDHWSGPHNIGTMMAFEWLNPQTLVRKMGENSAMPLVAIDHYMKSYREMIKNQPTLACPACAGTLAETAYEKIKILECQQCHGVLVKEDAVAMILARKEKVFDSRIQQMAQILRNEKQLAVKDSILTYESNRIYRCEKCQDNPCKMRRKLFNRYYPVEIDKCNQCGLTWFDKDELEIMQCLYEMRIGDPKNKF